MKKNLYFRTVLRRRSKLKALLLNFMLGSASWPRMLIEVFIRSNFGRRYFSIFSAFLLVAVLILLYHLGGGLWEALEKVFNPRHFYYVTDEEKMARLAHAQRQTFWFYAFLFVFFLFAIGRHVQSQRTSNNYDFEHYSLSSGDFAPWILKLSKALSVTSVREIEVWIEPSVGFLAGLLLFMIGIKTVGLVLMVAGVFYAFSYWAAYEIGDNFVMDKIDERICNEELERAFVDGLDTRQTRGVRFYGRTPSDPEARRKIAESFVSEDEDGVDVE